MGLARSTYYDEPRPQPIGEARLLERIKEIRAEWRCYGYRRVTAELHAEGRRVNHKKVMRLMKEHGLTVRPRKRFVATTDSDHDRPILPDLAKDMTPTGPNQLWVADITYIGIAIGFVYLAAILDAWSRAIRRKPMARHRSHSIEFKRQVVQEYLDGETFHGLAKRHDISRNLVRLWVAKHEAGALDSDTAGAELLKEQDARIAALERLVAKLALENEFLKGASRHARQARSGTTSVVAGPMVSRSPKDAG